MWDVRVVGESPTRRTALQSPSWSLSPSPYGHRNRIATEGTLLGQAGANAEAAVAFEAVLGALAVLSSDERNMGMMREEGMEQLIEKFEKIKDDRVKMFVKQLKDRLQNTDV